MLTDSSDFISYVFYVWVGLYNFKVKLIVFESSFLLLLMHLPITIKVATLLNFLLKITTIHV